MKKIAGITIKVLLGLVTLILVLLFTVPVIFKKQVKAKVESVINESVNAVVKFEDYKLGFFRNFPNLSFSLKNMSVVGINKFEGDTLAGFKSFDLVFNLGSLLGKSGYEIKSVILDRAVVNAAVRKDGSANWDIAKPSVEIPAADSIPETDAPASESSLKVLLKKFEIKESKVSYSDESSSINASVKGLNYTLSGDMTLSQTDLKMALNIGEVTVVMDKIKYLDKASIDSRIDLLANLDSLEFTFGDNFFSLNDLRLNFSGTVAMPGDDIITNVSFGTEQTSFKTFLSLVPAFYMSDYKDLRATGHFALAGSATGVYSEADSTLPDIKLRLTVNNGLISYPTLPEKISEININTDVTVDGKDLDRTIVNIDKFHFELAGSPFDMTFFLKTPVSDPDFKGSMNGRIDLAALSKAVPMDSINLSGVIEMAVTMAGKLSMIEKEQYESFSARGTMGLKNMLFSMSGYPEVNLKEAAFLFTPAFTEMHKADIVIAGNSDFSISGRLENYIPYIFRNETIKGKLALRSRLIDASAILASVATDTTVTTETDTTTLSIIFVPKNIDFDFNALIDKFKYDNINADNVKGHIVVKDGILSVRETGMNILGGKILMNADYDTRDTIKPVMKADFSMQNINVKDAFNTFNTVQKLAPAAKGIDGKISVLLDYRSMLGSDMLPVVETIEGKGKLRSDEIQIVESKTFDKFREVLKLGDKYNNTFRDVNISFRINDGRVYVDPFNVKMGNIKMNIGGDQGLDQTLNYLVKTEIPRSDLGGSVNALIDNLTAQAAAFGVAFKPSDIIKVNVKVTGTFAKPEVRPAFGSTAEGGAGTVKEMAKEAVKKVVGDAADKAKDKARNEAEIQGDKLIREAEERGQQLRDEAAKASEKVRQEAENQAQRLITAAESKGTLAKAAARKAADALKNEADKKANLIIKEADVAALKVVEEAKAKKEELIKMI